MSLYIDDSLLSIIFEHSFSSYPRECCGLLIGFLKPSKKILEIRPMTNISPPSSLDRFEIDPVEFITIDSELEGSNRSIIGFYHSHPDHTALLSSIDLAHAWPGYSYLIVSLTNEVILDVKSWILASPRSPAVEEKLIMQSFP